MKRFDNEIIHRLIIPCLILICLMFFLRFFTTVEANSDCYQNTRQPNISDTYIWSLINETYPPRFITVETEDKPEIMYTSFNIPDIDSTFKAYLRYEKITDKTSNQYKFIAENAYIDNEGFLRYSANADYAINEDCYLIALGSHYGTEIGTIYRITTDTGNVFYGVLGDCKDDKHTDSNNQYTIVGTYNVVEFIVDTDTLNKDVKYHGNANWYEPLSGNIISIEKMDIKVEEELCR